MRDCKVAGADCSLAQFDRIYNQGKKNHFTILGSNEVAKFDYIFGGNSSTQQREGGPDTRHDVSESESESAESAEEENQTELYKKLGIEADDIHFSLKVIL